MAKGQNAAASSAASDEGKESDLTIIREQTRECLELLRCKSARKWDPVETPANPLMMQPHVLDGWGSNRRRSGPHPERILENDYKTLSRIRRGSHLGADSQRETIAAMSRRSGKPCCEAPEPNGLRGRD